MGNLSSPIRSKVFHRYGNAHFEVAVCSMQGFRPHMEDSHLVELQFSNTNHVNYSLFAIFDGHNGKKASEFLSNNLWNKLNDLPSLKNNEDIINTVLQLDREFCHSKDGENGSTIVFAIVEYIPSTNQYQIRIFWAGDSRALLINHKDHTFKSLSVDHSPNNVKETMRILAANGTVTNNRVDSKLAVSRAFGDCSLKRNHNIPWTAQKVVSTCDMCEITANANDELLLFCDGLVEYVDSAYIVKFLKHCNTQKSTFADPVYKLALLFDGVLDGGSRDNMSAISVKFKNGCNYGLANKAVTFLPGPLYMARHDKHYVTAYLTNAASYGHQDGLILRRAAYREDLKFLMKFECRDSQQSQYTQNLINEIANVIKNIDELQKQKNDKKKCKKLVDNNDHDMPGLEKENIENENEDIDVNQNDTDDNDGKEDFVGDGSGSLVMFDTPNKQNKTKETVILESPSPNKNIYSPNTKRKLIELVNDDNESNSDSDSDNNNNKRRKTNNGQSVKLHVFDHL